MKTDLKTLRNLIKNLAEASNPKKDSKEISKELANAFTKNSSTILAYLSKSFGKQKFFQKRTKANVGNIAIDYSYDFYNDPNSEQPLILRINASVMSNDITSTGYTTTVESTVVNKKTKKSKLLTVEYPDGQVELEKLLKTPNVLFSIDKINKYLTNGY